ncbi:hypothetical protein ABK040_012084 [Willaertia magna]
MSKRSFHDYSFPQQAFPTTSTKNGQFELTTNTHIHTTSVLMMGNDNDNDHIALDYNNSNNTSRLFSFGNDNFNNRGTTMNDNMDDDDEDYHDQNNVGDDPATIEKKMKFSPPFTTFSNSNTTTTISPFPSLSSQQLQSTTFNFSFNNNFNDQKLQTYNTAIAASSMNNNFNNQQPFCFSHQQHQNQQNYHHHYHYQQQQSILPTNHTPIESHRYKKHLQHLEYLKANLINQQKNFCQTPNSSNYSQNGYCKPSFEQPLINIKVKSMNGNCIYFTNIDIFENTLLDIKEMIYRQTGLPINKQRLVFKGKILPTGGDDKQKYLLSNLPDIEQNVVFQLICGLKGG